jgi:5S rRNA maturation endonuclease (ribonuclease M5)
MTSAFEEKGRHWEKPGPALKSSSSLKNPNRVSREFQPITAAEIAACAEGVKRTGDGYLGRCLHPQHEDKNPSMSFCDGPNGALVHCLSGCDQTDLWAAVLDAVRRHRNEAPTPRRTQARPFRRPQPAPNKTAAKKLAQAKRIYENTREATGTPAGVYLQGRGVTAPPGRDLRACPRVFRPAKGREEWALVACVTDTQTGEFLGVQCRFLDEKPGKWHNVGNFGGGAVQLAKPKGGRLAVCESFIDALSITQLLALPCWATCGAENLKGFRPPPGVSEVIIFADDDRTGHKAARALVERLKREGLQAKAILPPERCKDMNDALSAYEERAAIMEFDAEMPREQAEALAIAELFPEGAP